MTNWVVPIFGPLAWIDVILLAWFTLTAFSVIYVAYDAITNNPEMKVMKWGWILVTLYLGPHRFIPLHHVVQRACAGNARGVRQSSLEAKSRLHDSLRCRRRHRHYCRRRNHRRIRFADVDRSHRRVRCRIRVWLADLSVAVYERHDGVHILWL